MPANPSHASEPPSPRPGKKASLWAKFGLSVGVTILCYAAIESVLTYAFLQGTLDPELIWVVERVGTTSHMEKDDLRGYRLAQTPARMACITTDGRIESTGQLRGNNLGFPDRDDFFPQRTHRQETRLAVFGDSFTASPYLEVNWPDRVEDLAARGAQPIKLLNFSIFGGGLGNWWSILTRIIQEDDYELDGVVFVVFVDDLQRSFYVCDDTHHQQFPQKTPKLACGFSDTFDPASFSTVNVRFMRHTRIISPENFDLALTGDWRPDFHRPFELFVWNRAKSIVGGMPGGTAPSSPTPPTSSGNASDEIFDGEQLQLIDEMATFLKSKQIPVWVYHFPAGSPVDEAQEFARRLGAQYRDISPAFQGLSEEEQQAQWMIDGHWNQTGSDRFAKWFIKANGG